MLFKIKVDTIPLVENYFLMRLRVTNFPFVPKILKRRS